MLKIATKFAPETPAFERAWRAGFRYAEFYLSADLLENVKKIIATAREYPFEYVPHFPNKKVTEKTVAAAVELYRQLGCRTMVIHQPMIDQWGATLKTLHPEIRLAVENHYLDEKQIWDWAEKNPGLNLDIEHLWKFTLQDGPRDKVLDLVARILDKHLDKLNHIHLPGYVPGHDEHRPMYCSRELMFEIWNLLRKKKYAHFMVSEINSQYQTFEDLKMDVLLFERWWTTREKS